MYIEQKIIMMTELAIYKINENLSCKLNEYDEGILFEHIKGVIDDFCKLCSKYENNKCISDEATIDDALRELIEDSDLEEVVSCLDMICNEQNKFLLLIKKGTIEYPNLFRQN